VRERDEAQRHGDEVGGEFLFLVCYADTQLALQLHQKRIHLVHSTKIVRRIQTESNGTPAYGTNHVQRERGMCV